MCLQLTCVDVCGRRSVVLRCGSTKGVWTNNQYTVYKHIMALDSGRMQYLEKRSQPAPDCAGDELFSHSRRAQRWAPPTNMEPPFGRDEPSSFHTAFRSPRHAPPSPSLSPRPDGRFGSLAGENALSCSPPVIGRQSCRPWYPIDSRWRASDDAPFSIDGSPRARIKQQQSTGRDPELSGGWANPKSIRSGCAHSS